MAPPSRPSRERLFLLVFLAVNLVLASYYVDLWCTPNPVSRVLPVLTLLETGSFRIDKYAGRSWDEARVGDHYYSDKAPLPSVAAVPLYWLMQRTGLARTTPTTGRRFPVYIWESSGVSDGRVFVVPEWIPPLFMCGLVFGSLPFALLVFLAFVKIRGSSNAVSPVVLVMMSFYGSFMFVFAGTFFSHVLTAFLLVSAYVLLQRTRYFASGAVVGLAFMSEYPVALAIPLWALAIWANEKRLRNVVSFALGVLPSVVLILLYNSATTGHVFTTLNAFHDKEIFRQGLSQHYGFRLPSLQSLWGLSFSAYMGLLPHVPVLLLCGHFATRDLFSARALARLPRSYLAMFAIPYFLLFSSFFTWWGGWSYGPRYLTCLAALLVYEGVAYLSTRRVHRLVFLAITGIGVLTTWLAKITLGYMIPDHTTSLGAAPGGSVFSSYLLPQLARGHFNANNLATLGFGVTPGVAALLWLVAFALAVIGLSVWHTRVYGAAANGQSVPRGRAKLRREGEPAETVQMGQRRRRARIP